MNSNIFIQDERVNKKSAKKLTEIFKQNIHGEAIAINFNQPSVTHFSVWINQC